MIFAIREGLRANLLARKFPVSVSVGKDRPLALGASRQRHRVVIDHDRSIGDQITAPIGSKINPSRIFSRYVGYSVMIYAFEPQAGAQAWEHEVEVQRVVDGVLVALADWAQAQGSILQPLSGRMLTTEELQAAEASQVAGYVLQIRMGRSVNRVDYDGSGADTGVVFSTNTSVLLTRNEDEYGEMFEEVD